MAITDLPGLVIPPWDRFRIVFSNTDITVNASGEKAAWIVLAPKTGNIRKVHLRCATIITPVDSDIRIETVDLTTGFPSGSLLAANNNATIPSASFSTGAWVTSPALTADAAVTKGDLIAVVLAPTGSPNMLIHGFLSDANHGYTVPYGSEFGAAWAKSSIFIPSIALEYSDGSFAYMPGVLPYSAVNTHTYNSGSTPDEYALRFTVPAAVRVSGAWAAVDSDGDYEAVLYEGTTARRTLAMDKEVKRNANGDYALFTFSSAYELAASTVYYLAIKPTSGTNLSVYSFDVNSAAILDQLPGGQAFHYATRTDAGAWSATTTRRLLAGLILDGIDLAAAAGGGPLIGGRLVA